VGTLPILVTRAVLPLAAETVALMAGASPLSWRRAALTGVAGSLPGAVLYGLAAALAPDFGEIALVFGTVLVLAAALWFVGRRIVASQASWADR
jgi:uncharacterized membrane protein YdjX (TVP38/TMEM64 family)